MKGAKMTNRQKILGSVSAIALVTMMGISGAGAGTAVYDYDEATPYPAGPTTTTTLSNFLLAAPVNDQYIITGSGLGAIEFGREIIKLLNLLGETETEQWFEMYKHGVYHQLPAGEAGAG